MSRIFQKHKKNSWPIWTTKIATGGFVELIIESVILNLVENHSTFVENGCAFEAMQHWLTTGGQPGPPKYAVF